MNVRGSLLNDLPAIERIYRYCLPLLNRLTCETTVSSFRRGYNLSHVLLVGKTFRISQVRQSTVNALFSLVVGGSQRRVNLPRLSNVMASVSLPIGLKSQVETGKVGLIKR